jgi:thioredoxin reductase
VTAREEWEVVVVGAGAAGLSAALVLGRARRRTLVFDVGGQSNRAAPHVGGGLALDGTPPDELYSRGREQVAAYDSVVVEDAEVSEATADDGGFVVVAGDRALRAQALILATGMDYEVPDIAGFREHWGAQVFHCPFCHGWEVRDRKLVVCAEGDAAARFGPLIRGWSDDVTMVEPGDVAELRDEEGVVQAVVLKDGSEVTCEAVLVYAPLRQRGRLTETLSLELTEEGLIAVDELGHTSVPGVYAAGDVAVAPQQVPIAMASGHLAGIVAVRELLLGRPA